MLSVSDRPNGAAVKPSASEPKWYVECVGHRWSRNAVDHRTEATARAQAERDSRECFHVNVYRVTLEPIASTLIAVYANGVERPQA